MVELLMGMTPGTDGYSGHTMQQQHTGGQLTTRSTRLQTTVSAWITAACSHHSVAVGNRFALHLPLPVTVLQT